MIMLYFVMNSIQTVDNVVDIHDMPPFQCTLESGNDDTQAVSETHVVCIPDRFQRFVKIIEMRGLRNRRVNPALYRGIGDVIHEEVVVRCRPKQQPFNHHYSRCNA